MRTAKNVCWFKLYKLFSVYVHMVSDRVAILGADSFFMCVLLFMLSQFMAMFGIGIYTYMAFARLSIVLIIFHDLLHNAIAKSVIAFQSVLLVVDMCFAMVNLFVANYLTIPFFAAIVILQFVQIKNMFALMKEQISSEIARSRSIRKFSLSMGLMKSLLGMATPTPFAFLSYFLLQIYSLYYEMSDENDLKTQRTIINSIVLFWGCVCTWIAVGASSIIGTTIVMFCCIDILLDVLIIISTIKTP